MKYCELVLHSVEYELARRHSRILLHGGGCPPSRFLDVYSSLSLSRLRAEQAVLLLYCQQSVSENTNIYEKRVHDTCHATCHLPPCHTRCGVEVLGERCSNSSSMLARRSSHQPSASSRSTLAWYKAARLSALLSTLLSVAPPFLVFEFAAFAASLRSRDGAAGPLLSMLDFDAGTEACSAGAVAAAAGNCALFSAVRSRRWTESEADRAGVRPFGCTEMVTGLLWVPSITRTSTPGSGTAKRTAPTKISVFLEFIKNRHV